MKASKVAFLVILIVIFMCGANVQPAKFQSYAPIYIRSDGSVDPSTAPIQRVGNTYTLTNNIYDSVVVEKGNVVFDGMGYFLQGEGSGYGIHLIHRSNVTIRNTLIKDFNTGIRLYGGSNNTIHENDVVNNEWGIYVEYSENNTLSGNYVANNMKGIQVIGSSNSVLRNNHMNGNHYNFGVIGDYVNDVDASNTVDDKPIYYWVNEQERTVPLDAGHVVLVNCTGISVKNLNLTNNWQGILLASTIDSDIAQNTITRNGAGIELRDSSRNNHISGNYVANNEGNGVILYGSPKNELAENTIANNSNYGVDLYFSDYNTISENRITESKLGIYLYGSAYNNISDNSISDNGGTGIWFFGSSHNNIISNNVTDNQISLHFELQCLNNTIYHNNFVNNDIQFLPDTGSVNSWDNGVEGNYWSDYDGTDKNGDGIGDTPYVIDLDNVDNYPLLMPYEASSPQPHKSESFQTLLIVATMVIIVIAATTGYLVYRRRK